MPPFGSGAHVGETLEDYLAGEYHTDMNDIRDLEETLERVANLFIYTCEKDGRWPYEIRVDDLGDFARKSGGKVSHGTQAMIAAALVKMSGDGTLASERQAYLKLKPLDALQLAQNSGIVRLQLDLKVKGQLESGTFGLNDPVTLSHVADLIRATRRTPKHDGSAAIQSAITSAVTELARLSRIDPAQNDANLPPPDDNSEPLKILLANLPTIRTSQQGESLPDQDRWEKGGRQPDYVVNAFVPLRVVRAVNDLTKAVVFPGSDGQNELKCFHVRYGRFFESTLHDQLSFSAIPDSRFDPAELIFCLEGLMICSPHAVDEKLFEKVLAVLKEKQDTSAHWRPIRPIYATPQGMAMLPVSVEGAVSLMRSISLMEGNSDYQPLSRNALPMARRFWQWLRARAVDFSVPDPSANVNPKKAERPAERTAGKEDWPLTGWQSEHVNDPGLIHLWGTSQVAEFMLAYRELLQRSIAGRTLLLSRLQVNEPLRALPKGWFEEWKKIVKSHEPRLGAQSGEMVYTKLEVDFVVPWAENDPVNFSMLLFGPPGTGKSSVAKNIAKTLGMRMLTVTVSDFLGRGGANVEAHAKAIFQTLEAQSDTVILFDEIDSFLLDRDTQLYRDQDTLFQFLTPGFLTKINDLRQRKRSIFIIATNYENRIDPAIKRKGRIDKNYLLQLPNMARRIKIIEGLGKFTIVGDEALREIALHSLFFGYSDLDVAVRDAKLDPPRDRETNVEKESRNELNSQKVCQVLQEHDRPPASSLKSYLRRHKEENYPFREIFELFELKAEVVRDYSVRKMFSENSDLDFDDAFTSRLKREMKNFQNG